MANEVDPNQVALREITADTVITIVRLSVSEDQKKFVAPNAVSLAQALFAPEAWCPGCPEPFYLRLRFQHTGRMDEDEVVLELPLAPGRPV